MNKRQLFALQHAIPDGQRPDLAPYAAHEPRPGGMRQTILTVAVAENGDMFWQCSASWANNGAPLPSYLRELPLGKVDALEKTAKEHLRGVGEGEDDVRRTGPLRAVHVMRKLTADEKRQVKLTSAAN